MSKGRPFFAINDDDNNPINQLTANLLGKGGRQGKQKGDSRSTIPGTNFRYPKGFTPPVDFYTDEPKRDLKDAVNTPKPSAAGARSRAVAGVDSRNLGGGFKRDTSSKFLNPETGLHVEYGNSLLVDGYLRANKDATTKVQGVALTRFPNIVINPNDFSPDKFYVDDQNIHDGLYKRIFYSNSSDLDETVDTTNFVPIEYGFAIRNDPSTSYYTEKWVNKRRYFLSYDNEHSLRFTHLLDYYLGSGDKEGAEPVKDRKKYLTDPDIQQFDWSRTLDENEDPTILGVDLKIKADSPLLNGDIEFFIKNFEEYGELKSRTEIVSLFKTQLLKFFDTDQPISQTDPKKNKAYYLQGITGLDNLVESTGSDGKYFIDFGKDVITLEFLEDVTQNMGYLASLYKTMSYSRLHGKELIPRNLLRFDIDITITEMRPYLRNIRQTANSEVLKKMNREGNDEIHAMRDEISRYTYTLYECRFLFDKMPHGDEVKNGESNILPNFKISFDYKYSTLNFKKYKGFIKYNTDGKPYIEYFNLNNRQRNPIQTNEKTIQNNQIVDTSESLKTFVGYYSDSSEDVPKLPLIHSPSKQTPYESDPVEFNSDTTFKKVYFIGTEQLSGRESTALLFNARRNEDISDASKSQKPSFLQTLSSNLKANKVFDQLKSGLINAAAIEINQRILSQAALLNKTLDNIRNSVGLGRMSEPTNVYLPKSPFESAIRNTLRNAIGGSVKSFFQSL